MGENRRIRILEFIKFNLNIKNKIFSYLLILQIFKFCTIS
jgi:hypothetical protein